MSTSRVPLLRGKRSVWVLPVALHISFYNSEHTFYFHCLVKFLIKIFLLSDKPSCSDSQQALQTANSPPGCWFYCKKPQQRRQQQTRWWGRRWRERWMTRWRSIYWLPLRPPFYCGPLPETKENVQTNIQIISLDPLFRNAGLRVLSGRFGTNICAGQVVKASN